MKLKIAKIMALAFVLSISTGIVTTNAQTTSPTPLRDKLQKNKEIRNTELEEKKAAVKSVQGTAMQQIKNERGEMMQERQDLRNSSSTKREIHASSTDLFKKFKDDRKEIMKKMKRDSFEIRKNALVKELNIAISNLTNIRARINDRIVALEGQGKVMTDAKASLVIADDKLAKAKTAVDALAAYSYPTVASSTTSTASSTMEIDLEKPRKIGDAAIKAVKDARDAFKNTIQMVVKVLGNGLHLGNDKDRDDRKSTSTPSTSTTTNTGTTTTTI